MYTDTSHDKSITSNPVLKPGVTAEDLAARLLQHKISSEMKIKQAQDRKEQEIKAAQKLKINTNANDKILNGRKDAPIYERVEKELQRK